MVDGGTLRVRDSVVRLDGIAPPARGEVCHRADGSAQDCGVAAANELAALVHKAPQVDCQVRAHDAMGRALAVCDAQGKQLNHALVAAGWARVDGTQAALQPVQAEARAEKRGLWGG